MTPKIKSAWAASLTFIFTALVTIFREFEIGYVNGIWFIWLFWCWNYFAYAFDRGMLPSTFIELDGGGKGNPSWRAGAFWITALVHFAFLATMAFAD
ncbi:hypothetical protein [Hydrogenophaga sp.]|uniref:hypothetical protein n=1 Tax=Hydrogenophaga sp. TaxID=1904254 RepID=UPI003F6C0FF8